MEKVINAIKKIACENKINIDFQNKDTNLKSLGIDSLKMMNLIFKLEKELNVMIPDEELIKIKTLNDLINTLNNCLNKTN